MRQIIDLYRTEPVRTKAALMALVAAIINGPVVFDLWAPTTEQVAYLNATASLVFVFADLMIRNTVTPNRNVAATKSEVDAVAERLGRPVGLVLQPMTEEGKPDPLGTLPNRLGEQE